MIKISTQTAISSLAKVGIKAKIRQGELVVPSEDKGWGKGWKYLANVEKGQVALATINSSLSRMGTGTKRIS